MPKDRGTRMTGHDDTAFPLGGSLDEQKFEALAKAQPIGRAGKPEEIASVVLLGYVAGSKLVGFGHAWSVVGWLAGGEFRSEGYWADDEVERA